MDRHLRVLAYSVAREVFSQLPMAKRGIATGDAMVANDDLNVCARGVEDAGAHQHLSLRISAGKMRDERQHSRRVCDPPSGCEDRRSHGRIRDVGNGTGGRRTLVRMVVDDPPQRVDVTGGETGTHRGRRKARGRSRQLRRREGHRAAQDGKGTGSRQKQIARTGRGRRL